MEIETILYKEKKRPKKKRRGLIKRLERQLVVNPKVLKSKLDEAFQRDVRETDGKCLMGEMWGGCSGPIQAGHVLSRRHLATRWDRQNCFGQCRTHNFIHTFNPNLYISWYVKTYGSDQYEALVRKSRTTFKPGIKWLQEQLLLLRRD